MQYTYHTRQIRWGGQTAYTYDICTASNDLILVKDCSASETLVKCSFTCCPMMPFHHCMHWTLSGNTRTPDLPRRHSFPIFNKAPISPESGFSPIWW